MSLGVVAVRSVSRNRPAGRCGAAQRPGRSGCRHSGSGTRSVVRVPGDTAGGEPLGGVGVRPDGSGDRGQASTFWSASTVLSAVLRPLRPVPVVMAWSPPLWLMLILRGLARSATGMTSRSTPSR